MDLPVELNLNILSFLTIYDLGSTTVISKHWYQLVQYLIVKKANEITLNVLASMVKCNTSILVDLRDHLSDKMIAYLCSFYAYQGDETNMNYCLRRVPKSKILRVAAYAYYGSKPDLICELYLPISPNLLQMKLDHPMSIPNEIDEEIKIKYNHKIVKNKYGQIVTDFLIANQSDFYKYKSIVGIAVVHDRLDILKITHSLGRNFTKTSQFSLDILLMRTYKLSDMNELLKLAIIHNRMEIFQWLLSFGYSDKNELIYLVIARGRMDMLTILIQYPPVVIYSGMFWEAIMYGYREIAEFLLDYVILNEVDISFCDYERIVNNKNTDIIKWLLDLIPTIKNHIIKYAVHNGAMEILKYALQKNTELIDFCMVDDAIKEGHLDVLVYLDSVYPFVVEFQRRELLGLALESGRKKIIKWLINKCHGKDKFVYVRYTRHTLHRKKICYMNGKVMTFIKTNSDSIDLYQKLINQV